MHFRQRDWTFPSIPSPLPVTEASFTSIHRKRDGSIFFRCGTGLGVGPVRRRQSVYLPAALQGIDIDQLLAGARQMDDLTREKDFSKNPAAMLALSWHYLTDGKGAKDMVILPYKDRLELFAKYLQQLIMESLGKEKDLQGNLVYQGISVYGNKGSTDQHAYVQQLREGVPNFFATFIEVLKNRDGDSISVDEDGMDSGDYLHGFFLGTRDALYEKDRKSITLTISKSQPLPWVV